MILELNHKKRSWDYSPSKDLQNKFFNLNSAEAKESDYQKREENLSKYFLKNSNLLNFELLKMAFLN